MTGPTGRPDDGDPDQSDGFPESDDHPESDDRDGVSESGPAPGSDDGSRPVRVMAQGTFDLLHPGHLHYFEEAAAMGDELYVVVARRENVTHKAPPVLPNRQRRDVVAALDVVDDARVGHPEDIFVPVEAIEPDVIALGFDQHHDVDAIRAALDDRGIDCAVRRASPREPRYDGELLSTGAIVDRILAERSRE